MWPNSFALQALEQAARLLVAPEQQADAIGIDSGLLTEDREGPENI